MARGDKRRRKDDSTKSRRSEPSDVKANSPAKRLKGDSNGSVGVAKSGPSASAVINEKPKRTAPVQDEPQLSPEELRSAGLADCTALRNVVDRLCSTSGDPTSAEVRDLLTASLLLTTDVKVGQIDILTMRLSCCPCFEVLFSPSRLQYCVNCSFFTSVVSWPVC